MDEYDYILATNIARLMAARDLLKAVTPDARAAITEEELRKVQLQLGEWLKLCRSLVDA